MIRQLARCGRFPAGANSITSLTLTTAKLNSLRFASSAADSDPKTNPLTSKNPKDWPEDGMVGPYPNLPYEYYVNRRQDIKYDDQQGRRNLGEPLHHQFDMIDVWSPDHFDRLPDSKAYKYNSIFFGLIGAFSFYCWHTWEEPKFVRRNFPFDGLNKALGGNDENKELMQARADKTY